MNDNIEEDVICHICGDLFSDKYSIHLSCNHKIHYECALKIFKHNKKKMFSYKNKCPYCRGTCDYLPIVNGITKCIPGIHFDPTLKDTSEDPNKDHNIIYCQHILTRGKNKGSCCLNKPMIGYTYCKQHKGKI